MLAPKMILESGEAPYHTLLRSMEMRRLFFIVFLFGLFSVSEGVDDGSCLAPHSTAPLAAIHVSQSSGDSFLG